MPWGPAPTFQVIVPSNAGPNDPRIEIGADMPADLIAKYATVGETIVGGIVFYRGTATQAYFYLILSNVGGSSKLCIGGRTESTLEIAEYFNIGVFSAGAFFVTWGRFSTTAPTLMQTQILNNNLELSGAGTFNPQLILRDGTTATLMDGGFFNVLDTASILMFTDSVLQFFNNSTLKLDLGTNFEIDGRAATRKTLGAMTSINGVSTSSVVIGTEVARSAANWGNEPTFVFEDDTLYRIDAMMHPLTTGATNTQGNINVRKGSATIAGQLLLKWYMTNQAGAAGQGKSLAMFGYVKNVSGATISTKLSVSVNLLNGAGSMTIYGGDATAPMILTVTSLGPATGGTAQTELASIATAIV